MIHRVLKMLSLLRCIICTWIYRSRVKSLGLIFTSSYSWQRSGLFLPTGMWSDLRYTWSLTTNGHYCNIRQNVPLETDRVGGCPMESTVIWLCINRNVKISGRMLVSLGAHQNGKVISPKHYNGCDYLPLLGLKLIHVRRRVLDES